MKPRWVEVSGRIWTSAKVSDIRQGRFSIYGWDPFLPEEKWRVDPQPRSDAQKRKQATKGGDA